MSNEIEIISEEYPSAYADKRYILQAFGKQAEVFLIYDVEDGMIQQFLTNINAFNEQERSKLKDFIHNECN